MNVFLTNLDKVQLVCIFISSFLISRVLIVAKIPERLVLYLIGKKHLPISTIIFYVIFASALLSFFIPNVITVLTLLPMIKILRRTFEESLPHRYKALETIFPLSIIYGANIGGMGSITGTPANGIMVLYATFHNLPGLEYLNFQYWLVWGVPLVLAFILTAWFVLNAAFRLWTYQNELVQVTFPENRAFHPLQRTATRLTVLSFLLFVLLSVLMKTSEAKLGILLISVFLTLLLIAVLFLVPLKGDHGESSGRLLSIRDCYSNLPWRGLAFVGIIIAILGLGALLNLEEIITRFFERMVRVNIPGALFYPLIALLTSFCTEIFSNTVVQVAMFSVVASLPGDPDLTTFCAFLIITLSCTNAFMTPIATGVNGLAFGEMKGISFSTMLIAGLFMKLLGVVIIAFGAPLLLGWVLP
ncbi:MAG: hypothetical protein RBT80_10780 [Candidatus Vecturithrix sp.]|jgi:sodium-dependent dicarboxylate transporter 2/3/5|nr:hypothetical protein [Candidatus Vecturithrix sp.]